MSDPDRDPVLETAVARPADAPAGTVPSPPPRGSPLGRALAAVFLHDWALKGLALLLAVLTWQLVRERLETKITVTNLQVDVGDVPSDVVLVGSATRRVQITLLGTRAEVERARALLEDDPHVKVSLPELPPGVDGGTTPPIKHSEFRYPFERPDLVVGGDSVQLDWVRVAERNVTVVAPDVVLKPGTPLEAAPGWPTLEATKVRVRGPKAVVETLTSLRPDPIDPSTWLDTNPDLSSLFPWSSGFDSWRANLPLRSERVLVIEPATVRGRLKLRLVAAPRAVEHALRLVLPSGPADVLSRWDVLVGGPEYDRTRRVIRLTLKGDKKALDELEANPDGWSFVAEIPVPSDTGEPVESVRVPVRLLLGVVPGTGKPLGAGVVLEGAPVVLVTLKKRM